MGASKCDLSCAKAAASWDAAQTRRPRSEISARALQELCPPPFDLSLEPSKARHQHLGGRILKLLKLLSLTRKPKPAFPPRLLQSTQFPTLDESSDEASSRASNSGSSEAESTRSHLSNSQLMANTLISIMGEKDLASGYDSPHQTRDGPHESAWHQPHLVDSPSSRATSSMKHSRGGPRPCADHGLYTSPGPSRRFGKLDLSKIEVYKIR